MGRGRAKAKQQKVARELKYGGPNTDLSKLAVELSNNRAHSGSPEWSDEEPDEDKYADWIEAEDAEDEELVDDEDER